MFSIYNNIIITEEPYSELLCVPFLMNVVVLQIKLSLILIVNLDIESCVIFWLVDVSQSTICQYQYKAWLQKAFL